MDPVRALEGVAVAVVVCGLALSGPAVGLLAPTADTPATVGDGNATVADVTIRGDVVVDRGRFGSGVNYLRLPDARVDVAELRGEPRLIYEVRVPGLDVEATTIEQLGPGRAGASRLRPDDRALAPGTASERSYAATVTVRVQSFELDRTVYRANRTVEVVG